MAIVPTQRVGSVESRPTPFVPLTDRGATADAFGAAQGAALANVGQAVVGAANQANQYAARLAYEDDVRYAREQDTALRREAINASHDFFSLKGEAAVQGYDAALKRMEDYRTKQMDAFGSRPRAADMFRAASDQVLTGFMDRARAHLDRERDLANTAASVARIQVAGQQAAADPNDERGLASGLAVISSEINSEADRKGLPAEWAQNEIRKRSSDVLKVVIAQQAVANPTQALATLSRFRGRMDADDVLRLEEHLKPKLLGAQAEALVVGMMGAAANGGVAAATGNADEVFNRIHKNESAGRMTAGIYGDGGAAAGPLQVHAAALADVNKKWGTDHKHGDLAANPELGKRVGRAYFDQMVERYDGDLAKASAAYNAGPGRVDEAVRSHGANWQQGIPAATRGYVGRALGRPSTHPDAPGFEYPDFAGMQERIIQQTGDNPELRQAALSKLSAQKSLLDTQLAARRTTVRKQANDVMAALSAGRTDVAIPESDIRAVFPRAEAEDTIAQMTEAKDFGYLAAGAQWADDQAVGAMVQQLRSNTDVAVAAANEKHVAKLQQLVQTRRTALAQDPAAYVASEPTVAAARAAAAADPSNPELAQAAVDASLAVQRRLGVGEFQTRVLPKAAAQEQVARLHGTEFGKGDVGAAIDQMARTYGPQWPAVFRDLKREGLSPEYEALAAMDNPASRAEFQKALSLKAELKGSFNDGIPDKLTLYTEIARNLEPVRATIRGGGADLLQRTIAPSVQTLAEFYAIKGMAPGDAAALAFKHVIGDKYDFNGPSRIPKTFGGKPLGADAVIASGNAVQAALTAADVLPVVTADPNVSEAQRRQVALSAAKRGWWSSSPDDQSATLFGELANGQVTPILGKNGKPITIPYDNLPKGRPATPVPFMGVAP